MTTDYSRISISELDRTESDALLGRNHFGRIAYSFHDRVSIEPISYVFDRDWIFGRTSPGTKWLTLLHHPWVAFEVEEVVNEGEWKTVVVHGTVTFINDAGTPSNRELFERAVARIQSRTPLAMTEHDRAPERDKVFGIHINDLSGRQCTTVPVG